MTEYTKINVLSSVLGKRYAYDKCHLLSLERDYNIKSQIFCQPKRKRNCVSAELFFFVLPFGVKLTKQRSQSQIAYLQTLIFGCIARKMPFHKTEAYLSYVRVWEKVSDKARRQIAKFELVHFVVDFNARTHCCCNVH